MRVISKVITKLYAFDDSIFQRERSASQHIVNESFNQKYQNDGL